MLKSFLHWRIRAFEQRYDYDATYMHEIADTDTRALMALQRLTNAGQYGGTLPQDALFAARLAAALFEDCGPCVQVVVNIALEAGVEPTLLATLAAGHPERVAAGPGCAFRFARAVLANSSEVGALREEVVQHYGAGAPYCLGLALSVARAYPVLKRAMGHAHTCQRVEVGGELIATGH